MSRQTLTVRIKPGILKWVLETSGWEMEELEKKLKLNKESMRKLESKEPVIELKKLEKLSECVKRPLAVFFMDAPPTESELTDYRKIAGLEYEKFSKKTFLAMKESRYLQSIAKELLQFQNLDLTPKVENVTVTDDPELIALTERKRLGFESEEFLLSADAKKSPRNFFNLLREKIESLNIFVFQVNMPLIEARGFTLTDGLPRVIIVNSSDSIKPKIFTLLHEYGHIILKKEGICLASSELNHSTSKNETQNIESWCNTFAASVLMPKSEFLYQVTKWEQRLENPKEIITKLSNQFNASKQSVAVRISILNPDSSLANFYKNSFEIIKKEDLPKTSKKKGKGGPDQINSCISKKGRKFISLVLNSKEKDFVTYNDVMSYLNLNLKYLDRLQEKL